LKTLLKEEAQQELQTVRRLIADHFSARYNLTHNAATHIAAALLEADRGREILSLINNEKKANGDPRSIYVAKLNYND